MKKKRTPERNPGIAGAAWLVLIAALAVATAVVVIFTIAGFADTESRGKPAETAPAPVVETRVVEKEVERKITAEMIREGLRDMGFLVTRQYDFTLAETYTTEKDLFLWLKSTSGFMFSYDGTVTAGIDFTDVEVVKDEEMRQLRISLPKAEFLPVSIDTDSFVLYSEKEGFANPISMEDYNIALADLQQRALEKAEERGVLQQADEQAEITIAAFVRTLIPEEDYQLVFEHMEDNDEQ